MHSQDSWESCAQNKTSDISKNVLFGMLGLMCAEQNVGNIKKMNFQKLLDFFAQNKTSEISTNGLSGIRGLLCVEPTVGNLKNGCSGILGLLCAEQNVGNLKKHRLSGSLGLLCASLAPFLSGCFCRAGRSKKLPQIIPNPQSPLLDSLGRPLAFPDPTKKLTLRLDVTPCASCYFSA